MGDDRRTVEGRRWRSRSDGVDYLHRLDDDELVQELDDIVRTLHTQPRNAQFVEKIIVQTDARDITYTAEVGGEGDDTTNLDLNDNQGEQ